MLRNYKLSKAIEDLEDWLDSTTSEHDISWGNSFKENLIKLKTIENKTEYKKTVYLLKHMILDGGPFNRKFSRLIMDL